MGLKARSRVHVDDAVQFSDGLGFVSLSTGQQPIFYHDKTRTGLPFLEVNEGLVVAIIITLPGIGELICFAIPAFWCHVANSR